MLGERWRCHAEQCAAVMPSAFAAPTRAPRRSSAATLCAAHSHAACISGVKLLVGRPLMSAPASMRRAIVAVAAGFPAANARGVFPRCERRVG